MNGYDVVEENAHPAGVDVRVRRIRDGRLDEANGGGTVRGVEKESQGIIDGEPYSATSKMGNGDCDSIARSAKCNGAVLF